MHQSKNTTPLVICNHKDHPTGSYGCFRWIDRELLQNLLSMIDKNKVEEEIKKALKITIESFTSLSTPVICAAFSSSVIRDRRSSTLCSTG